MKKKPNILVIITDQQRADTIGALGNPLIKTPVLDGLCERGTAFTPAYTPAPICSPTRVAMATGIEPHRHRFTDHDWWHWEPEDGPRMPSPHDPSFMILLNQNRGSKELQAVLDENYPAYAKPVINPQRDNLHRDHAVQGSIPPWAEPWNS